MKRYDREFYWPGASEKTDMEKRWKDTDGDHIGEVPYQYFEMFHCPFYTDTECDYERQGCLIQPGDVVVDVGGNMGMFARRAWERGASRIISFEPQRDTFMTYLKNSKPEMEAFNMAIGDKMGVTTIKHGGSRFTGGGSIMEYGAEEGLISENVIVIALDSLFAPYGMFGKLLDKVDFLKIDIEGAEELALRGISDDNLKKFRCISMEIHRNIIDDETRDVIVNRLTNLGYKHFAMFYGGSLATYNFWKA